MDGANGYYEGQTEVDEKFRTVFVGGLDVNTSDEALREYFEKYGEIVDYVVTYPVSKRPRAFVTFENPKSVDEVQKGRPHDIDGRTVETRRAIPKEDHGKPESKVKVNKLFIGGVRAYIDEIVLRDYFIDCGVVTNVHVATERGSTKKRGFAFVEFDDYDPVDKAVLNKSHSIGALRIDVKKALSKQQMEDIRNSGNQRGGDSYGGRGGGRNDGYSSSSRMSGGGDNDESDNAGPVRSRGRYNQRSLQGPYSGGGGQFGRY